MLTIEHARDLQAHVGSVLGHSHWMSIEQDDIDAFARLTGDDHWIHVDVDRASQEMPEGKTIAHGLYILSLIPRLQRDIYRIVHRGRGLNYGYDRIRFLAPVPVGSRIRLKLTLADASPHRMGMRIETEAAVEIEGAERAALVARNILLIEDATEGGST